MDSVELHCSKCNKLLLKAGRGSIISGVKEFNCRSCGTKTIIDPVELMNLIGELDGTYRGVVVDGDVTGRITVKGGDGSPGKPGKPGEPGGDVKISSR